MSKKEIIDKLKKIKDPELDIDIVSLGLIRDIIIDDTAELKKATVIMTLTTPFCPFADQLINEVEKSLTDMGYEDARVELTFTPLWEPTEDIKRQLGL